MSSLQKINLGTAPGGKEGDTTRAGFAKMNANVDVLTAQVPMTSAPLIAASQTLTDDHIGKRISVSFADAGGIVKMKRASTCAADSIVWLINVGTQAFALAPDDNSGDTVALRALNPGEAGILDTDGVHTWRVLLRGRTWAADESVSGKLSIAGDLSVGGGSKFSDRPTFAGKVPWDSGNFDPNSKLDKTGGAITGFLGLKQGSPSDGGLVYNDPGVNNCVIRTGAAGAYTYFVFDKNGGISSSNTSPPTFYGDNPTTNSTPGASNDGGRFATRLTNRNQEAFFTLREFIGQSTNGLIAVRVGSTWKNWQFRGNDGNAYSDGQWINNSDKRLKKNIVPVTDPLAKMRMLRGCTWDRIDTNTRGIGLIADDVYTAFGEFVYISEPEKTLPDGTVINDVKAVDTGGVGVALHHEAILALMDEIDSMRKRVAELEAKDTP